MTPWDNMGLAHADIIPAWLRTLEYETACKPQRAFRGEFYIRGKIRRFVAHSEVVDLSLMEQGSDTPVIVGTESVSMSSQKESRVISLTALSLMSPSVPLTVAQCLYNENVQTKEVIEHIEQLLGLIASLSTPLKVFLTAIFSDADIAERFVSCPASHNHHHAKPGGLLIHSVDCALMVKRLAMMRMDPQEAEITTVAALLHDIGKTRTHEATRSQNVMGQFVSHESAGLELLTPYLKDLDAHWETGANLLRHMLGWDRVGQKFPAFPGTLLVKLCDQLDTALDLREQSYEGKPSWYGYAYANNASDQCFLRIPS